MDMFQFLRSYFILFFCGKSLENICLQIKWGDKGDLQMEHNVAGYMNLEWAEVAQDLI